MSNKKPPMLTVVNWEKYQTFKDRRPSWIKLHDSFLDDYAVSMLSEVQQLHLVKLWLLAARTVEMEDTGELDAKGVPKKRPGIPKIPYDAGWLQTKLSLESPLDLDALVKAGFLAPVEERDKTSVQSCTDPYTQPKVTVQSTQANCTDPYKSVQSTQVDCSPETEKRQRQIRFTADAAGDEVEEEVVATATNSYQEIHSYPGEEEASQEDEAWAEWDREHPQEEVSKPVSTISLPEATDFETYKRNKIIQAMSDTPEEPQYEEDDSWMEDTPEPSLEDEPADPLAMLLGMVDQLTQSPAVEQEEPSGWDEKPEPVFEYSTDDEYLERVWHTHNFIATQFYNASTPWKVDWSTFSQRSANEQVTEILRGYAWTLIENQVHPDDFVHYYYTQWFNYKNESLAFNKEGKPLIETPGIGFPSRKWLCEMGDEVVAKLLDNPGWKSDFFPYPEEFGEAANA